MQPFHARSAHPAQPASAGPDVPTELWSRMVGQISLREGRTISSLACVSKLLHLVAHAHRRPASLYQALDRANEQAPPAPLHCSLDVLIELPQVDATRRLELFLHVSKVLGKHFPGAAIEPHVGTLMASLKVLPDDDQAEALLGLGANHSFHALCASEPRYVRMAACVGALPACNAQASLAHELSALVHGPRIEGSAPQIRAFLRMCMRLAPAGCATALIHQMALVNSQEPLTSLRWAAMAEDRRKECRSNRDMLLTGMFACLQSLPLDDVPADQRVVLLAEAAFMPALLDAVDAADRMVVDLLRMVPPHGSDFQSPLETSAGKSLHESVSTMLEKTFLRGPQQSIARFDCLYQAMAHLPPSRQLEWMRHVVTKCATCARSGVTPELIAATAQAALRLPGCELNLLYDLFALCLNPGTLRKANAYPSLQPQAIAASGYTEYARGFDANCRGLMQALGHARPDVPAVLLAGINNAYARVRPDSEMLPSPDKLRGELYGHFLKHSLAFLQHLPAPTAAACLLQWRLPRRFDMDARLADEQAMALLAALKSISRDSSLVSPAQLGTALAGVMEEAVNVMEHSPVRNRRLLGALAEFPDAVCAQVHSHPLANRHMGLAHLDVLFASIVEAAARLPDALRASVLASAAQQLPRFPEAKSLYCNAAPALQQQRDEHVNYAHPGLEASDPELHAYIRPGCVTRTQGFGLLLDAVETLQPQYRPALLEKLGANEQFFVFSSGRFSPEEKAQCSMRLVAAIIRLPAAMAVMRTQAFSSWLKHLARQSYADKARAEIEDALLPLLFALPVSEGKPLFDAYLETVWPVEARAAVQRRAALHWKEAV